MVMKAIYLLHLLICCGLSAGAYAGNENARFEVEEARTNAGYSPETKFLELRRQYQLALEQKEVPQQAALLKEMGTLCFHLGHYAQAMEYYLNARKLLEAGGDQTLLAALYNELGTLYYYNKNTDKVKPSHDKALQLYTRLQDIKGMAGT